MKQKKQLVLTLLVAIIVIIPLIVSARGLVPCGGDGEAPCNVQDIFVLIARITNWLIMFAGVYAVFEIVNNGFWLVVTMGNEETITQRRKGLTNAVVGFVLAMLGFIFINTTVNLLLLARCNVTLKDPFTYLRIVNSDKCDNNPVFEQLKK